MKVRLEVQVLLAVIPAVALLGTPLGVLGLGVVSASGLALQAAGLVLVFRSNRFLNLAQVQLGAVAGTLFALLVNGLPALRGIRAVCPPCLEHISATSYRVNSEASREVSPLVAVGPYGPA